MKRIDTQLNTSGPGRASDSRGSRMGRGLLAAVLLGCMVAFAPSVDSAEATGVFSDDAIRRSIVLVRISPVRFHRARPWLKEPGESFTVAGLVLPGQRILVLGNDIRDARLLEATKFSSYRRSLAKVQRLDLEANLALLTVEDPNFFSDLKPLPVGQDPVPGSKVTAVKVDDIFRVYRENAHIMEVNPGADFGYSFLPVAVFRTGEPIQGGGLLLGPKGVAGFIGYADQDKKAEAIPPSTFDSFQKRARDSKGYGGFVSQGFYLQNLVDPVRREFYSLPAGSGGAIVTRILPGTSAYGVLQKEDILLSIDGVKLDARGFYEDPRFGRQPAQMLLARKGDRARLPGETAAVTVLRKGKRMSVKMPLKAYAGSAERIPWLVDGPSEFFLENGVIFLELSVPFMREVFGNRWQTNASHLSYLFATRRFYAKPGEDRVVIMAGALPDDANRGYENLPMGRVETVNGKPVVNLRGLFRAIEMLAREGAPVAELQISGGYRVFLDLKNRDAVNQRILKRYRLPGRAYFRRR